MSQTNGSDAAFGIIVILSIVVGAIAIKFSDAIGVSWETGLEIIAKMIGVLAIGACYKYFSSYDSFTVWPLVLAGLFWAWFPAIDVWAVRESHTFAFREFQSSYKDISLAWFGMWYTKTAIIILIVGGGYYLDSQLKKI